MKIVFLEKETLGEDIDFTPFNQLGEVELYSRGATVEENADHIADADVLVVNKIPINEELLCKADNLKLIAASATGTNNIDFEYTSKRGIIVSNARDYSTDSVVQHTFAILFYLYEKLPVYDRFVKTGDYTRYPMFSCFTPYFHELLGKTWGIIGLGAIGRQVAKIATAFGCNVIYYSASGNKYDCPYENVSFDKLLESSDIISIHCPLTPVTNNLIDEAALKKVKKEAVILNLARGPIINETALADALNQGRIAAAGLDVLCVEPMSPDSPFFSVKDKDKLLITPHIGWGTTEARSRCVDEVYKNIEAFKNGSQRNVC